VKLLKITPGVATVELSLEEVELAAYGTRDATSEDNYLGERSISGELSFNLNTIERVLRLTEQVQES
jgi:hypothetical protein